MGVPAGHASRLTGGQRGCLPGFQSMLEQHGAGGVLERIGAYMGVAARVWVQVGARCRGVKVGGMVPRSVSNDAETGRGRAWGVCGSVGRGVWMARMRG
jgi:hypothetical protein